MGDYCLNTSEEICSYIKARPLQHGETKLHIDGKMMIFAVFYTNTLSWICTALSPLNASCLCEKQQIPFYCLYFDSTDSTLFHLYCSYSYQRVGVMVFNAILNNISFISWRSV